MPAVLLFASALLVGTAPRPAGGQPVMTRGPEAAPVTIVEYSDYQ